MISLYHKAKATGISFFANIIAFLANICYNTIIERAWQPRTLIRGDGDLMTCGFQTNKFKFEYIESEIDHTVLWESHCHSSFEMIAVLKGDVSIMLEGRVYRLKENQQILIPPLSYHAITVGAGGTYRRVTALFEGDAIPDVLRFKLGERDVGIAISSSSCAETLRGLCQASDPSFYAPLAHSLMIQLFYDALLSPDRQTGMQADPFLQSALSYIDDHLGDKISLDELAAHTSRSKSSFCHLFEQKMNLSPKQYILQKKLALADKLLGEGTSPSATAARVGYENYSDFYRMYKKHFGSSPTKKST